MKKISLLAIFFTIVLVGCSSLNVNTDYDQSFDFSKLKKFRFASDEEASKTDMLAKNPFLKNRIRESVKNELVKKGYQFIEGGGADFVVNLMVGKEEKTSVSSTPTVSYGYGYGYWGGYYGGSSVTVTNYTEGTLIIDLIDTGKNQLVWRGVITDVLDNTATTQEEKRVPRLLPLEEEKHGENERVDDI